MARTLSPRMRERAAAWSQYFHTHYQGGGPSETRRLMKEFPGGGERRNPSLGFGEEVAGAALGTVVGLLALTAVLVAFTPRRESQQQCRACQQTAGF